MDQDKQIQSLTAQLAATNAELRLSLEINEKLSLKIDQLSKSQPVQPVSTSANYNDLSFVLDGITYGFKKPAINIDGKIIKPYDVLASEELQQKLVSIQSGFIRPQT